MMHYSFRSYERYHQAKFLQMQNIRISNVNIDEEPMYKVSLLNVATHRRLASAITLKRFYKA